MIPKGGARVLPLSERAEKALKTLREQQAVSERFRVTHRLRKSGNASLERPQRPLIFALK